MLAEIGWALVTAALSSVFTLAAAKLVLDRWGSRFVQRKLEDALVSIAGGRAVERTVDELMKQTTRTIGEGIDALLGRRRE